MKDCSLSDFNSSHRSDFILPHLTNNNTNKNSVLYTIYHQNLCGLNNKKDDLEIYLNNLKSKVNCICISEHFLNKIQISQLQMTSYKLGSYNTRVNKKRGGTLVLTSDDRQIEDIEICKNLYKQDYFEVCGLKDLELNTNIVCCYRTPVNNNFDSFLERLEQLLKHFFKKQCLICGDFNINLMKDDKYRKSFLSLLACYNFRSLFDTTTFIRNGTETCIDNILTNLIDTNINDIHIDHNGLSDGHIVFFAQ